VERGRPWFADYTAMGLGTERPRHDEPGENHAAQWLGFASRFFRAFAREEGGEDGHAPYEAIPAEGVRKGGSDFWAALTWRIDPERVARTFA